MLTIGVGPTFATRWLIPRLADFQKTEPDIEVRFATGGATLPYNDDWTCGIRLGDGDWPGFVAERMFAADLMPVCSPAIAKRLKSPDDLRNATLLRVAHASDEWPLWFKAVALAKVRAKGPEFEYYGQALAGGGGWCRRRHGHQPLRRRRLESRPAGRAVCAVGLEGRALVFDLSSRPRRTRAAFSAFRAWITRAAARRRPAPARTALCRSPRNRPGLRPGRG